MADGKIAINKDKKRGISYFKIIRIRKRNIK